MEQLKLLIADIRKRFDKDFDTNTKQRLQRTINKSFIVKAFNIASKYADELKSSYVIDRTIINKCAFLILIGYDNESILNDTDIKVLGKTIKEEKKKTYKKPKSKLSNDSKIDDENIDLDYGMKNE